MEKIALVTGASSGIGKETALALAKQGFCVIIHGRNPEKTKAVFDEIKQKSGNKNLDMFTADLSLMNEVRGFAEKIKSKYSRLDVLINNAGGQFGSTRKVTAEGHEKTFAINTLAPFLLTNLLLPLLEKSALARVVTVSSESYKAGGEPNWNDVEFENDYSLFRSYGLSKRYVWWLMREFARRLSEKGIKNVTVNTCEPGSAVTSLSRESGKLWYFKIIGVLWLPFMRSAKTGAKTSIYLASSSDVEGKTGGFYGKCKEKKISAKYISEENQKKIWNYCERVCGEENHLL